MRQLLIDKPEGLGFYPLISATIGGVSCVSEDPQLSAPFWIENLSDSPCTVTLTKNGSPTVISLDYSSDQSTWTTFTNSNGTGSFEIPANSKAYVKGDNSIFSTSVLKYKLSFNQRCNIGGNIMSLVERSETLTNYMFCGLFDSNINIIDASKLMLPATTLASYCYQEMFRGCTSLTTAPELPATTLAQSCYAGMFFGCTSLTTAPALPATILVNLCYDSMFYRCTSLTTAPALPATTLANYCYYSMFQGCTSLTTAPALPATTLAEYCYQNMFNGCTSLTTAPALPATTLASYCYHYMFDGCTNLNYVKALFTTTPSSTYTNNWLSGVASTGTFVKNASATWNVIGTSGVPSGWTVETAVA